MIVDQHLGPLSTPIYRYLHHEPFHPEAKNWVFPSVGPLSDANGALAWIIFERDRARFDRLFPRLKVVRYEPHTPLRYWLSGGLKWWSLLPGVLFSCATRLDEDLMRMWPRLASFVDIEIEKQP